MAKLKRELAQKIAHLPKITKSVAAGLILEGKDVDVVLDDLAEFAQLEEETYRKWFNFLCREVKKLRIDKEAYAYTLATELENGTKDVVAKLAEKAEAELNIQKQFGRTGRLLQSFHKRVCDYLGKCEEFQQYAKAYIMDLDYEGLTAAIANSEEEYRCVNEDKLFHLQTLKHLRQQLDHNRPISSELYQRALRTRFSDDSEILNEQVMMVYSTWSYNKDNSLALKQMSYDYIKYVMANLRPHLHLIEYLFKGDWISRETHDLLVEARSKIYESGMHPVVCARARKLFERRDLGNRPPIGEDKFIIKIMEQFEAL